LWGRMSGGGKVRREWRGNFERGLREELRESDDGERGREGLRSGVGEYGGLCGGGV
jgi:hypothetical protein